MSELSKLEINPSIANNLLVEKSEISVHLDHRIGSMSDLEELKPGFNVGRERSFSGNVHQLKSTDSLAKRQSFEKKSETSKDRVNHVGIPALPLTSI